MHAARLPGPALPPAPLSSPGGQETRVQRDVAWELGARKAATGTRRRGPARACARAVRCGAVRPRRWTHGVVLQVQQDGLHLLFADCLAQVAVVGHLGPRVRARHLLRLRERARTYTRVSATGAFTFTLAAYPRGCPSALALVARHILTRALKLLRRAGLTGMACVSCSGQPDPQWSSQATVGRSHRRLLGIRVRLRGRLHGRFPLIIELLKVRLHTRQAALVSAVRVTTCAVGGARQSRGREHPE